MYRRRGGFGRLEERALILRLLKGRFPTLDTTMVLRRSAGAIRRGSTAGIAALRQHEDLKGVRDLQDRFLEALAEDKHLNLATVDASFDIAGRRTEAPVALHGQLAHRARDGGATRRAGQTSSSSMSFRSSGRC